MSGEHAFAVARDIVMVVVTILVFYWGRDRKQIADALEAQFKIRDREIAACCGDVVEVQADLRTLADAVRGVDSRLDRLPDELRTKFLPLDRAHDVIEESRRDRAAIWSAVRGRPGARRTDHEG